jgi:hypothetical protein
MSDRMDAVDVQNIALRESLAIKDTGGHVPYNKAVLDVSRISLR